MSLHIPWRCSKRCAASTRHHERIPYNRCGSRGVRSPHCCFVRASPGSGISKSNNFYRFPLPVTAPVAPSAVSVVPLRQSEETRASRDYATLLTSIILLSLSTLVVYWRFISNPIMEQVALTARIRSSGYSIRLPISISLIIGANVFWFVMINY